MSAKMSVSEGTLEGPEIYANQVDQDNPMEKTAHKYT